MGGCHQSRLQVAVRHAESNATLSAARLVRSPMKFGGPIRLNMPARGALTNLKPVPLAERRSLVPGFVQLRIARLVLGLTLLTALMSNITSRRPGRDQQYKLLIVSIKSVH